MITENKFLNDEELKSFLTKVKNTDNTRDRLLMLTSLYTGARSREVLNIRPADIGNQTITIYGLKGSDDRTIPILDERYFAELKRYVKDTPNESKVFPITTRHFRRLFDKFCTEKKLHSLRHTMGIKFYEKSRDLLSVKKILGHKQVLNTMYYMDYVESQETFKSKMKGIFD